jgi:DNA topoisomerase-1
MPETPPGLRYVSDDRPGITRVRRGRGFSYHRLDGELVADEVRDRVEALAIPPAWDDVWICPTPTGHLQATGRDAKGRKQYRYHPDWEGHRNRLKFDRMVPFGEALPGVRARVEEDLGARGLGREKVLALCVRLLDETLVRVGNEQYAAENASYGLTTIRDKHVAFDGSEVRFEFVGKSGKVQEVSVRDRRLARLVKACRDIPGYDLFQFYDEAGEKHDVESGHVNGYLQETTGEAFTAKDFRTWGGTVTAAERLAAHGDDVAEGEADGLVVQAVKDTAAVLGNTPAVCRRYYVHPDVLDAFREGDLADRLRRRNAGNTPAGLRPPEAAVLDLLKERAA